VEQVLEFMFVGWLVFCVCSEWPYRKKDKKTAKFSHTNCKKWNQKL